VDTENSSDNVRLSKDMVLLILIGALGTLSSIMLVGLLPFSLLLVGLIASLKTGEIGGVRMTTRWLQACAAVGVVAATAFSLYHAINASNLMTVMPSDPSSDERCADVLSLSHSQRLGQFGNGADRLYAECDDLRLSFANAQSEIDEAWGLTAGGGAFAVIFALAIGALNWMWLGPLSRTLESLRSFSWLPWLKRPAREKIGSRSFPSFLLRPPLPSVSVADELGKWSALRDAGAVTEEQFQEVRGRLLGGR
jgi:hypothetical protein